MATQKECLLLIKKPEKRAEARESFENDLKEGLTAEQSKKKFKKEKTNEALQKQNQLIQDDNNLKRLQKLIDEAVELNIDGIDAIKNLLITNVGDNRGARQTVEKQIISTINKYIGEVENAMIPLKDYKNLRITEEFNNNIKRERARLNGANIESTGDDLALRYAKIINNKTKELVKVAEQYRLDIEGITGFSGTQTWDSKKLALQGKDEWIKFIKENADQTKTPFFNDDKVLSNIWDKLIKKGSISNVDNSSLVRGKSRKIFLKNVEAEITAKTRFGSETDEVSGLYGLAKTLGRDVALFNSLGSSPLKTLDQLTDYITTKTKKPDNIKDVKTFYDRIANSITYNETGEKIAAIGRGLRRFSGTTILGNIVISTTGLDKKFTRFGKMLRTEAQATDYAKQFNPFEGLGSIVEYIAKGKGEALDGIMDIISLGTLAKTRVGKKKNKVYGFNEKQLSELQAFGIETNIYQSAINQILRQVEANQIESPQTGKISKFMDGIDKAFGDVSFITAKTMVDNLAEYKMLGKELADSFKLKDYSKIDNRYKIFLRANDITEKEYNLLSKIKLERDADDVFSAEIFYPNDVRKLSDQDIIEYGKIKQDQYKDKADLQKEIEKVKNALDIKIRTLMTTENYFNKGYGDARVSIKNSSSTGAVRDEIFRTTFQLKSFAHLVYDNLWKRIFKNTSLIPSQKVGIFATFAASSVASAYIIEQMKTILKGETPKTDIDSEMALNLITRAGFGGIIADILLPSIETIAQAIFGDESISYSSKNKIAKGMISLSTGVVGTKILDIGESLLDLLDRQDADKAVKTIKGLVPANNVFYVNGLLTYISLQTSEALGGRGMTKKKRYLNKEDRDFLFNVD